MCRPECLSNHELLDIAEGGHIVECVVYIGLSSAQDTSFSRLSLSNVRRVLPGFDVEICNIYGLNYLRRCLLREIQEGFKYI